MKTHVFLFSILMIMLSCSKSKMEDLSFDEYPVYPEENLWLQYSPKETTFSLWSPVADDVVVHLYEQGDGGKKLRSVSMKESVPGLWRKTVKGDLNGTYYTFQVKLKGEWLDETPGIYATAVGVNGQRAMVLDLPSTNPDGWEKDKGPKVNYPNEAIIYELHVRDLTTHQNAGSTYPGKYIGLVESGTLGPNGVTTGIDHLQELGITHVHLLPSYDHYSIDESKLDSAQFNWGYDPQNYNVPEGSYSTDPNRAEMRIMEFKEMVKGFHDADIGVILDVVYNHTGRTDESNFNQEVPGYYYRFNEDGTRSDASACGNETASERAMMRKFIVESVCYWAREYHLDGFRFDLMGIHDIQTMNEVAAALKKINPDIFVYGEGWTAGGSPLSEEQQALKKNTKKLINVSAFSDDIRDGLKGSVFIDTSRGFVSGAANMEASIRFGVVGSIDHPQIDYTAVNYSKAPWANEPWQAISYVSCHDNHTLFDKLNVSRPDATAEEIKAMHKLSNAIVLTSQGVSFLHAGVEMMRTKGGEHNSYNLPDEVNQFNWEWKTTNQDVVNYYQSLISLRKNHPAFFMPNAEMVREKLTFLETEPGVVGFTIKDHANGDSWQDILVVYNGSLTAKPIPVEGSWRTAVLGDIFNEKGIGKISGKVTIPPISMMVAFRK
jgi:pullulanase